MYNYQVQHMSKNIGVKKEINKLVDSQEGKTKFFAGIQHPKSLTLEEAVAQVKSKIAS